MAGVTITGTFIKGSDDGGTFAINKADSLLIPMQIAATLVARDNLGDYLRMPYMLCYVVSEAKTYRLQADLTSWVLETEEYIPVTEKGTASGVAPLNADGKIPTQYLDTLNLSSTFVVEDITEMISITTYKGNLVIVQDASADPDVVSGSATYAKVVDSVSVSLNDFLRVEFGASVSSVNGQVGAVSLEFDDIVGWSAASQTQFDTAVATHASVALNTANILTLISDVQSLDTLKANLNDVLTLTNTTLYDPTDTYHPATKKYVDDTLSNATVSPGGVENSIQVNSSNILQGYENFQYASDVLIVPSIRLTGTSAVDNNLTNVLVIAGDGTIKLREVASLGAGGGSGHVIQNEGIDVTNRKNLNFVGNLVNLTDDSGNDAIIVNILNPAWGDITGSVTNQTDLQDELNDKADKTPTEAHIAEVESHIDWSAPGGEQIETTRLPPAASSDAHYFENIPVSASVWNITHNLGKKPAVVTTDVDGNEFIGTVEHISDNALIVRYSVDVSGNIYLN